MIVLDKESHQYTNENGIEYTSVTRFINKFVPGFNFIDKSKMYAAKYGLNVDDVRNDWTQKNKLSTEFGTKIHSLIEEALDTSHIPNDDNYDSIKTIYDIIKNISGNKNLLTEKIISNDTYKIAGTSDLIIEDDNSFSVVDFKTNKSIKFTNNYEDKFLLPPVSHLPNSEYFKYSLQLSFYALFYSLLTGKTVNRLFFYWLRRKNINNYENLKGASWVRYSAPYLKEEVEACLDYNEQD